MSLPPLPESFAWNETAAGVVLTCRPLDRIAPHAFTTRALSLSSSEDWRRVAGLVGAANCVVVNQIHGREVVVVRRGTTASAEMPSADVLVSDYPDVAIGVKAADCVPLLLADARTGAVAAVHAGWRGTVAGAANAALEALGRHFGCRPADMTAAIGPHIGACCYEVGSDLVDAFAAAGYERHLIDRWFRIGNRGNVGGRDRRAGILALDVAGANRDQLMLAGVPGPNIHDCGVCTAMHLDVLTSFRAEKERAVRIAGIIRARPLHP